MCSHPVARGVDNKTAIELLRTSRAQHVEKPPEPRSSDINFYQDAFRPALQAQVCLEYATKLVSTSFASGVAEVNQRGTMHDHTWDEWLHAFQIASIGLDGSLARMAQLCLRNPLLVCGMMTNESRDRDTLSSLLTLPRPHKFPKTLYGKAGKEYYQEDCKGSIEDAMLVENDTRMPNYNLVQHHNGTGSMANVVTRQQFFEAFTSDAVLLYDAHFTHPRLAHISDVHAAAARFEPLCFWPRPTIMRLPAAQSPLSSEPV